MQVSQFLWEPNPLGAKCFNCSTGSRFHGRTKGAAMSASARAVASHGRPVHKPSPASPANVSKRGLSPRLYAPNQTPIMVNVRLPLGILGAGNAASQGAKRAWNGPFWRRKTQSRPSALGKRAALLSSALSAPHAEGQAGQIGLQNSGAKSRARNLRLELSGLDSQA